MADDVLLGFVAETKTALEQVLAMVRGMSAGLISLGDQHPEVVINIANAAESLRTLQADIEAVRRGELDLSGQPLTINTEQVAERLDAVLGMLRGLNEEFLRLPDVAAEASAGVTGAADRMAESERLATEGAATLRSELAGVAREAQLAGEKEEAASRPLVDGARQAQAALSELYRTLSRGAMSVGPEFEQADRAIGRFAELLAKAKSEGSPIPPQLPGQLAKLQGDLLAVANDAQKAGVSLKKAGEDAHAVGAAGEKASSGGMSLLSRAFNRIAFSIELMLVYQAARKIYEIGEAAAAAAEKGQALKIALESAAGGAREGAEAEAYLRGEAKLLGFDVNAVAESYEKYAATARGANVALDEQRAISSRLMETVASLRLGTGETNKVLQLFSEIIDRGAVSTAQLRRRLSDELPGAMASLRAATGLTETELDKMTKGGQVAASALLPLITRLAEEVGGGYHDALVSAGAEQGRLRSEWELATAQVGERYLPALANAIAELRTFVEENKSAREVVGGALGDLAKGVEGITHWYREWSAESEVVTLRHRILRDEARGTTKALADAKVAATELEEADRRLAAATLSASDRAAQHEAELHLEALAASALIPQLTLQIEALEKSGRFTREEATAAVAAADQKILAARNFSEADRLMLKDFLDGLQRASDGLRRFTVDFTKQLGEQIDATRRYARDFQDELQRTGTVSKDAADRIVKEVTAEAKSFNQLPEAQRKAHAEWGTELAAMLREFQSFTTAYEKENAKQVKSAQHTAAEEAKVMHERETEMEKSIRKIAELGSKPIDRGAGADVKGAQDQLAKDKAELAQLSSKATQSGAELARMDELQQAINKGGEAVKRLQQQQRDQVTSGEAGNKALALSYESVYGKVRDLITEDDKFKAELAGLGPEAQSAFQHVTQGLLDAAQAGTVTEADFRKWGSDVAGIFVQAGVATQDFKQRLEANLSPLRTVAQMMDSLRGTAGQIAPAMTGAASATSQVAAAASPAAAASRTLSLAMKEQADEAAAVAAAERGAGLASADLAGKSPAVVAAFQAAAAAARAQASGADAAGAASISVSNKEGELIEKTHEAGDAWHTTTERVHEGTDGLIQIGDAMVKAEGEQAAYSEGLKVVEGHLADGTAKSVIFGTKLRDTTTATKDATDKSALLATGLKNEGTAVEQLNEKLPQLVSAHQQAGAAAERSAGSEQRGATAMGQLAGAATAAAPPVESLAASMQRIADANPGSALAAAAAAARDLLTSSQPLSAELDKETFYVDHLDSILRRVVGAYAAVTVARDADRASMEAWRAEARLDEEECRLLATCLASVAA